MKEEKTKIQGYLDRIEGLYVSGWVWDQENPEKRLDVVVYVDDEPVAEGIADLYREDLEKSGIGDGRYGFKIRLPDSLLDKKKECQIAVKVKKLNQNLSNSPIKADFQEKYKYSIEGLKGFAVEGNIINLLYPDEPIGIEILENAKILVSGYSNPLENGRFSLWLPKEVMDGKVHVLELRTFDGYQIGYLVEIINYISTPLDALIKYSKHIPLGLNNLQNERNRSFISNVKAILKNSNVSSEEKINHINQLEKNYQILSEGFENLKRYEELVFPEFKKPKVSIIIPVYNNFNITYTCLASIFLATAGISYEVIVVDDGSSDETINITNIVKNIKITRNDMPQGFLKACNKGAKLAEGEYIVILNNDVEVLENWLKELLWVFENYDKVGMVGAKLLYPDLTLQEAGAIVFGNGQAWNYGRNSNSFDPRYNYIRQVDYCSGACIMVPKWLWDELGGFDEEFAPAYWEETDLAFRVREKGYRVVYTPFSRIIHYEGMSCGKDTKSGIKQYQVINQNKLKRKWSHVLIKSKDKQNPSPELAEIIKDRDVNGRILCIDYEIPRPDKEAGGYATFQEIRLFQSLGFKVTFIPQNMAYLYGYVEDLQRNGIEVIYAPFYFSVKEFIEKRGKEFDLFYIVRWHVAQEYIDLIKNINPNAKILFNNADLHFLRELREAIATNNRELLLQAINTREKELEVMRKVDLVLSYNEVEHGIILSHNLDSTKIAKWPWVVYIKNVTKPFEEREGIAFLGNYRHFPNVSAVKFFIEKVMPLLKKELPDVRFLVYGSHMPEEFKDIRDENVVFKGYAKTLDEVFDYCKIFVAPLLSGAGIKGKVLEALSYGVPSVLSPIAVEGTGIRHGLEAFIAEKPEEYVEAIVKLYTDKKTWDFMCENALKFISEYSFEKARNLVIKALELIDIFISENQEGFYRKGM